MSKAFFIGRFQPFHNGHLASIRYAAQNNDVVYIGIGSTNAPVSKHNPFTKEERELMIRNSLSSVKNYEIYSIPDIGDNHSWVKHTESIVPPFDVIYSGSPLIRKLFRDKNYVVREVPFNSGTSGTQIREKIYARESWENLVPPGTENVIKQIDGVNRITYLIDRPDFAKPTVAVDSIIKYQGHIVFIRRGRFPFKGMLAFPGGHLDLQENCEVAAVREAKEETGLDVKIEKLLNVYSDPDRDPRGHYVTVVYLGTASGTPLAGDDANEVVLVPIEKTKDGSIKLAFDHNRMLKDAFEMGLL